MGIAEVLTIIFVVLKLLGEIAWSWWWVFSPLWIMYLIVAPICIVLWFGLIKVVFKQMSRW